MARKRVLLVVLAAVAALVAWQAGVLSPRGESLGLGGGDPDAPDAAGAGAAASDGAGAPGTADGGTLARSTRPVAKTKPATVDGPRITGIVVDRAGTPLRDARVLSMPDTLERTFSADDVGKADLAVSDAVTGEDGRFVVAVADAPYHALVVEVAGRSPALESPVRTGADVRIVVEDGAVARGVVMDADGTPVAGARVRWNGLLDAYRVGAETTSGPDGRYRLVGLPAAAATSARAVGYVPSSAFGAFLVDAEGFAPLLVATARRFEPGQDAERDFVLSRGATVQGTVVEAETEKPVADARVVLWSLEGAGYAIWRGGNGGKSVAPPWSPRLLQEARTGADGSFRLEHVPAQGFHPVQSNEWGEKGPVVGRVAAIATGYAPATAPVGAAKEGATVPVTLKVWRTAVVRGRALDAQGQPAKGAWVNVARSDRPAGEGLPKSLFPDGPRGPTVQTGDDGSFRLDGLAVAAQGAEELQIVGRLEASSRRGWTEAGDGSVKVKVSAGADVVAPDLVLKPDESRGPAVEVRVRVVDPSGAPVWGAQVGVSWNPSFVGARTDRDGVTAVSLLKHARRTMPGEITATASARGFASGAATFAPTEGAAVEVTITLKAAHTLSGRVVRTDGTGVPGVQVGVADGTLPVATVFPEPKPGVRSPMAPAPARPGTIGPHYGSATTDEKGAFVVEGLPEGPYHLLATTAPRNGAATSTVRALAVDVPTDARDVELSLSMAAAPPTGRLEGSVADAATKRPVRQLVVQLRRGDETGATAWAGAEGPFFGPGGATQGTMPSPGRFEFPAAPEGSWTLVAQAEGYRPASVEVAVRAGETTKVPPILLDFGVTVRGRARLPSGFDMASRTLVFTEADGTGAEIRSVSARLEDDGRYEATGLTPGRWRVASWVDSWSGNEPPPQLVPDAGLLTVDATTGEVRFDPTLVAAGMLQINCNDPKLPPPPWEGIGATDEQKAYAAACAIAVRDGAGVVVAEQRGGITRAGAGRVGWLLLVPGRYSVHIERPGEAPRDEAIEVKPSQLAFVSLAPAAPAAGTPGAIIPPGR